MSSPGRARRRVQEYAFELARSRKKKLTSVDKANVLSDVYGLWRDVFTETAKSYPDVTTEFNFVDAITMWFVKNPEWFDVVVTPNMFGDIITDLGAMIQGGLGLAPGGNINPKGTSMFEPIHGSAPKYKGMDVANPIATIWAGSLLLDHLGEHAAAASIVTAIEKSIRDGVVTKDMGGSAGTAKAGSYIADCVRKGSNGLKIRFYDSLSAFLELFTIHHVFFGPRRLPAAIAKSEGKGFVEILTLFFSTLLGATARNASAPAAVAPL